MPEHHLVGLTSIVFLGLLAQWLAWRTRLPAILLLLIFGFAAGATQIFDSDQVGAGHDQDGAQQDGVSPVKVEDECWRRTDWFGAGQGRSGNFAPRRNGRKVKKEHGGFASWREIP